MQDQIQSYIKGQLSNDERQQFHEWLRADKANRDAFFREKDLIQSIELGQTKDTRTQNQWTKFQRTTDIRNEKKRRAKRIRSIQLWSSVAAIVAIIFGAGWFGSANYMKPSTYAQSELIVPRGQTSEIKLADGTHVWLNSDTKFNFSNELLDGKRVVHLEGEAFFDVAHDHKHPFIVVTDKQQIEVLGTAFNVKSYNTDAHVVTTLVRGSVKVNIQNQEVLLHPGEQLSYNTIERNININRATTDELGGWREGRYLLNDVPFSEMVQIMERLYDVDIVHPSNISDDTHFSGVIKINKPIDHVLELINILEPITYEKSDGMIIINKK